MEKAFCEELTKKLISTFRGIVYTNIDHNILTVKLKAPHHIVFTYNYQGIITYIQNGGSTDQLTRVIEQQFRKTINSIFFK